MFPDVHVTTAGWSGSAAYPGNRWRYLVPGAELPRSVHGVDSAAKGVHAPAPPLGTSAASLTGGAAHGGRDCFEVSARASSTVVSTWRRIAIEIHLVAFGHHAVHARRVRPLKTRTSSVEKRMHLPSCGDGVVVVLGRDRDADDRVARPGFSSPVCLSPSHSVKSPKRCDGCRPTLSRTSPNLSHQFASAITQDTRDRSAFLQRRLISAGLFLRRGE